MKFGIFMEFENRQGNSQAASFKMSFDLVEAAEAWGLDGIWLSEMHFNPVRSVLSAPLIVASSIATRTKHIRIGMAVHVIPLNNPLRIAEEVATLDHISEGRFDFGIGRSGSPRAYDAYGIPYSESQARFQEALEIILEAWKGEPFTYEGTYYQFKNATVSPRPYQQPHPPLRMAATTAETFPRVAQIGLPIFVGLRGMDIPELRQHLKTYRETWREAGHPGQGSAYLRIPVYVGSTAEGALEEPRESISYYFDRQANMTRSTLGRADTGPADRRQRQADRLAGLSYEDILETKVAFGTPASLVERFQHLQEELGIDGVVGELNAGGLIPAEQVTRSLRLLTQEVMPAFQ